MVWEAGQSTRFDRSAARNRWTGTEFKQISHMSHFSYLHPSVVHQCCFIVASFNNMLFSKPHLLPSKQRQAYEFCIWLGKNAWLPLDPPLTPPWPQHKGTLSYHLPWPFSLHSSAVQSLSASLASVVSEYDKAFQSKAQSHRVIILAVVVLFFFRKCLWFCDGKEVRVGCQKSWRWLCSSGKHTWLLDWQGGSPILLRQRQSLRSLRSCSHSMPNRYRTLSMLMEGAQQVALHTLKANETCAGSRSMIALTAQLALAILSFNPWALSLLSL